MKRNYTKICLALVVGCILLVTSTFLSMANGQTGYEKFKQVLKNHNMREFKNGTLKLNANVEDNGKTLVNVNTTAKADEKNELMSAVATIKADGLDKSFEIFKTKDGIILKEKGMDQYLKFECNDQNMRDHMKQCGNDEKNGPQKFTKTHETILDAVVGDYKKNFTEKDLGNGKKEVNFTLSENEIPELVNTILSAKHENMNKKEVKNNQEACNELHKLIGIDKTDVKLPELESDIKVKSVNLKLTVDNKNQVNGFGFILQVQGKDANGKVHNLKATVNTTIDNIGATKVDTIDLNGKNVKTITKEEMEKYEGKLDAARMK